MTWDKTGEAPAQVWRRAKDAFARREARGEQGGTEPDETAVNHLLWSVLARWRARRLRIHLRRKENHVPQ